VRFTLGALTALAVGITLVASAAHVLSRTSAAPAAEAPAPPPAPVQAAPGERSVVGTIQRYDAAARQLTLAAGKTSLTFRITDNATIRQGSRRLKAEDLAVHRGERVKLRYSDAGGQRRADWIIIAPLSRPLKSRTH
jgi:hypothetical protein